MPPGFILLFAGIIALILIAGIAVIGISRNIKEQQKRKNTVLMAGKHKNPDDESIFTVGDDGELVEYFEEEDTRTRHQSKR